MLVVLSATKGIPRVQHEGEAQLIGHTLCDRHCSKWTSAATQCAPIFGEGVGVACEGAAWANAIAPNTNVLATRSCLVVNCIRSPRYSYALRDSVETNTVL